jgi:ribulose 1,5-bisphosphate synthetase/thiazole synthase
MGCRWRVRQRTARTGRAKGLSVSEEADVVVVGAGLAGLTAARDLAALAIR